MENKIIDLKLRNDKLTITNNEFIVQINKLMEEQSEYLIINNNLKVELYEKNNIDDNIIDDNIIEENGNGIGNKDKEFTNELKCSKDYPDNELMLKLQDDIKNIRR